MFGTTYHLPLNKNYVRHWGVVEAVRELIQNALDSSAPFEFAFDKEDDGALTLSIVSAGVTLPSSSLLLGSTTKADDPDSIGSFGEGYKIALLVLTREGRPTLVHNGRKLWRPYFNFSKAFDDDILCIEETTGSLRNAGLQFIVSGLTEPEVDAIRESCLHMQKSVGEVINVAQGRILLDKPGALYVSGLFICKTDLEFGYDVLPKHIQLERDRKTVDSWSLRSLSRDMWLDTKDFGRVAGMVERNCPDVEYVRWSSNDMVREACYQLFRSKHPTGVVAESQSELQELVKKGMTQVIVVNSSFASAVRGSDGYRSESRTPIASPHDILSAWFEESKYNMHEKVRATFRDVLSQSKGWRR